MSLALQMTYHVEEGHLDRGNQAVLFGPHVTTDSTLPLVTSQPGSTLHDLVLLGLFAFLLQGLGHLKWMGRPRVCSYVTHLVYGFCFLQKTRDLEKLSR